MGFFIEFSLGFYLSERDYFYLLTYFGISLGSSLGRGTYSCLLFGGFAIFGGILFWEFLGYKICLMF